MSHSWANSCNTCPLLYAAYWASSTDALCAPAKKNPKRRLVPHQQSVYVSVSRRSICHHVITSEGWVKVMLVPSHTYVKHIAIIIPAVTERLGRINDRERGSCVHKWVFHSSPCSRTTAHTAHTKSHRRVSTDPSEDLGNLMEEQSSTKVWAWVLVFLKPAAGALPPKVSGMSLVWLFLSFPPFLVVVVSLVFTFLHSLPFISPITRHITTYNCFSTFSGLLSSLGSTACARFCVQVDVVLCLDRSQFFVLFFLRLDLSCAVKIVECWLMEISLIHRGDIYFLN